MWYAFESWSGVGYLSDCSHNTRSLGEGLVKVCPVARGVQRIPSYSIDLQKSSNLRIAEQFSYHGKSRRSQGSNSKHLAAQNAVLDGSHSAAPSCQALGAFGFAQELAQLVNVDLFRAELRADRFRILRRQIGTIRYLPSRLMQHRRIWDNRFHKRRPKFYG